MPIYDYICTECGSQFEKLVMNGREKILCSYCKSDQVKKRLSTFFGKTSGGGEISSSVGSCSPQRGFS